MTLLEFPTDPHVVNPFRTFNIFSQPIHCCLTDLVNPFTVLNRPRKALFSTDLVNPHTVLNRPITHIPLSTVLVNPFTVQQTLDIL